MTGPFQQNSPSPVGVLLVSASPDLRRSLRDSLTPQRWAVREAESGADALEKLTGTDLDVLLLDTRLPDLRPGEFSDLVRLQHPELQIMTIHPQTGHTYSESSAPSSLLTELAGVLDRRIGERPPAPPVPSFGAVRSPTTAAPGWGGMIGSSSAMQRVYHAARLVARRDTGVLISGESGTGKDLVARVIHGASPRDKQPFVIINCAAIPEALLEAELFGYTKGSFTGAVQARIGRIHAAHGGTLFLDEIGEMPLPLQSKLLRFLEQGEVQRIGDTDTLKVDVRVVAATNADLKSLAAKNLFREDLYYRLAVFPIRLPPLRDRMDDLDALIESFLARFAPGLGLSPAARDLLHAHTWPGNIRELRNALERASLFAEGAMEIRPEDVSL